MHFNIYAALLCIPQHQHHFSYEALLCIPQHQHISDTLIKTHHITASVIPPHRPSNFNSKDFNNYPCLTYIYILT